MMSNPVELGDRKSQELNLREAHDLVSKTLHGKIVFCKKCLGRGYEGWSEELKQYVPCRCLVKAADKIRLDKMKERAK